MLKGLKRSFFVVVVVHLGVELKGKMFLMELKMFLAEQKMLLMEQKSFLMLAKKYVTKQTKNVKEGKKMFAKENRVQSDIIIAR